MRLLNAGGHCEQVAQPDICHLRITQWKRLRQILLGEDFLRQPVGKAAAMLYSMMPQETLVNIFPTEYMFGLASRFALPRILLVDKISVAQNKQTTVLAGGLDILEGFIEPVLICACKRADLGGLI